MPEQVNVLDAAHQVFVLAFQLVETEIDRLPSQLGEALGSPPVQAAIEKAGVDVRAYYQKIGFDPPAMMARWGVKGELGNFLAPRNLQ
jgi:hypothetical protein